MFGEKPIVGQTILRISKENNLIKRKRLNR